MKPIRFSNKTSFNFFIDFDKDMHPNNGMNTKPLFEYSSRKPSQALRKNRINSQIKIGWRNEYNNRYLNFEAETFTSYRKQKITSTEEY